MTANSAGAFFPGSKKSEGIVARLDEIRRVIDERFVAAGNILIKSIDGTESLVASLEALARTFNAKIVAATGADLTVAAAKLCTLPACHARHVENVFNLNRTREGLAQHISDMRCCLAYMRAFTLNVRIVAGGLAEFGDEFLAFADDISRCVAKGNEELKILECDLAQLQSDLGTAGTQGEILGRQIAALLPSVPDELTANAIIMSEHYRSIAAAAGDTAGIARDIHGRVARILAALQIGDITRQRVEHVQACIIKMEAEARLLPTGTMRRHIATCYSLMSAQLSDIDAKFVGEVEKIEKNMSEMAGDAGALLKLHGMAFARDGGKGSGFLHELGARVEVAAKLVRTIESVDQAAIETAGATTKTAHKLAARIDNIRSLRSDIQAMAHQAAEKCAQIGENGRPLSVMALEIREKGRQLEEAAIIGLATLDHLLRFTALLGEAGGLRPEDSKSAAAAEALAVAASRIREARDMTESNISEITAKGDAVFDMLNLSRERLHFREEIGRSLTLAAREAASLMKGAYRVGEDIPVEMVQTLDSLSEYYTMAQERAVHQRFVETLGLVAPAAEPASADLDAVLF